MFEIKFKKAGVLKEFSKDYVNVEDNLLALEHQVRQTSLYENKEDLLNPAKHRELNEAYLDMFVKMYGEQFDADDLKSASVETLETLNELYLAALGGKQEEKEKILELCKKKKVDCCSMSICSVSLKYFYVAILTIDKRYPCYMIGYKMPNFRDIYYSSRGRLRMQ